MKKQLTYVRYLEHGARLQHFWVAGRAAQQVARLAAVAHHHGGFGLGSCFRRRVRLFVRGCVRTYVYEYEPMLRRQHEKCTCW